MRGSGGKEGWAIVGWESQRDRNRGNGRPLSPFPLSGDVSLLLPRRARKGNCRRCRREQPTEEHFNRFLKALLHSMWEGGQEGRGQGDSDPPLPGKVGGAGCRRRRRRRRRRGWGHKGPQGWVHMSAPDDATPPQETSERLGQGGRGDPYEKNDAHDELVAPRWLTQLNCFSHILFCILRHTMLLLQAKHLTSQE